LLLDPSWGLLLVVVLATLFVGAARSLSFLVVQTQQQSPEVREANELKIYMAVLLPVIGSAMLVVLFYFLDQLSVLLVGLFTLSAFVSVTYALSPLCAIIVRWTRLAPEYKYTSSTTHAHTHTHTSTHARAHTHTHTTHA
jgi:Na+-transporting NADH:ubiquinone oxidoreductase subunit NqrB